MALPEAAAWMMKVKGTIAGAQVWNNVYHLVPGSELTEVVAIAIGAAVKSAYDELAAFLHPSCVMDEIEFRDLSDTPGAQYIYTPGSPIIGTSAEDAVPTQVAGLVSWRTAVAGRSGHGRTYIAGLAENAISNEGGPESSFVIALQDFAAAMTDLDQGLAIVSYFQGHTWSAGPPYKKIPTQRVTPLVYPVTTYKVGTALGTQRSRSFFS